MSHHEEHKLVEARHYRYCPWCASPLAASDHDGRSRMRCPNCDFIWYRNPIPAAGAIIHRDSEILLVKRKYPPRIGDWCFPAGFMEYDETPEQCCVRELKEETGLDIKITGLFGIYAGHDDPRSNAVLAMYLADVISGDLVAGDDAIEAQYFDIHSAPVNIAFQAHRDVIADYRQYIMDGRTPVSR